MIGKDPGLVNSELDRYLKVTPADIQRSGGGIFRSAARDRAGDYARGESAMSAAARAS